MKLFKRLLVLILILLTVVAYVNYPKLNLLAGYSAKYTASSVFIADRDLVYTDTTDLDFTPVNFATDKINTSEKSTTSTTFGVLTRKAIYREGLGSVLITDGYDINTKTPIPKRTKPTTSVPFPYGSGNPTDSVFSNVNYKKINTAIATMFAPENKTRASLVVYKDKIIAERYAKGFNKDSRLLGWSMTKSITGTIIGILQCQGKLSVYDNAPITQWQNDERKNITIHNLLQMNSGLEWDENYTTISDATKMLFLSKDMTKAQAEKKLIGKPNETWNYSSGTTNLLSGIIRKQFKSHQAYLDFWYTNLIDKIGMHSMLVEADLSGNYIGSSYGWATARDWSKFGLLYLKNGAWNGEHLFDEDWVKYATTPTPTSNGWYGAQIWLNAGNRFPDVPKSMYFFSGYQGQYVFVFPEHDLVVVRLGLTKNADLNLFLSEIVNAIQ